MDGINGANSLALVSAPIYGQQTSRALGYVGAGTASFGIRDAGTSGVSAPSSQSLRSILTGIATVGAGLLTGGPLGAATAGLSLLGGPRGSATGPGTCKSPTIWDPGRGICVSPGSPADVAMVDVTDAPGVGVGAFGIPSIEATVVGEIRGRPIRRCLWQGRDVGLVLGKDDRCYPRTAIPRKLRKWPRAPRPPVTAGDARAIRQARAAQGRVQRLATSVGVASCKPKGFGKKKKKKKR